VDPHCFDADPEPDPDPAQNLDADPDPDPGGGGGGVGQPKMCIPPGKILGTPLKADCATWTCMFYSRLFFPDVSVLQQTVIPVCVCSTADCVN